MTHLKIESVSRCHHRILSIQRLFIRTKFLEVVDGLILAETSRLIMLSGMQI